jgi:apolipoprotein N-acyltransferase
MARSATWVGTYALSGLTVVIAGSLLLLVLRRWVLPAIVFIAVIVTVTVNVGVTVRQTSPSVAAPHVVIVQPDLGLDDENQPNFAEVSLSTLLRMTGAPGPHARLILWPEGALRYLPEYGYPLQYYREWPEVTRARIAARLGPHDVLLTGGDGLLFDANGNLIHGTNSIFALDARGAILGRYDKAHLVPYGEYLPLPWLLRPLGLSRLVPGDVDFQPGPGPRDLHLPRFGPIGGQICYEIIFSGDVVDEQHRPSVIFNPSNDAWFGSWGPPQHLAQARMRAIEEGLPILRSTPTGISAVIAANGELLGTMPLNHAGVIDVPFPTALPPTLFSYLGNRAALIVGLLLLLAAIAIRRRDR